jgi:hypothetical protein
MVGLLARLKTEQMVRPGRLPKHDDSLAKSFVRTVAVCTVAALAGALTVQPASAQERAGTGKHRRFDLRADLYQTLEVNRVACRVDAYGYVCNSPGWGQHGCVWPSGSPNYYLWGSGLQLAGIIPDDAGFAWAGDTVGVYFMDVGNAQDTGDPVSLIFNSLNPDDLAAWPVGAMVRDTAIYGDLLIGRKTVSQQDLWVRIWDGDPTLTGTREHPMGVLLEERGLAWNFPPGNQDIIYFTYTIYNITATDRSVYGGLHPDIRDSIADIAESYVENVEDHFGIDIPPQGYTFADLYVALYTDPDVADYELNYSSAVMPFDMAIAYQSDFWAPGWTYPPEIHGPPFAPLIGLVGVKYLRSPVDPATGLERGLTLFSTAYLSSTGWRDPLGVIQLWRFLSGNLSRAAGDPPCTFPNPQERKLCFLHSTPADTRFYQSSGPLTLNPGESATIVVAYVFAAPLAAPLEGKVGGDVNPGIPFPGDSIAANTCEGNPGNVCVRAIDSIAGWVSHSDEDGSGNIEQDEVVSVPKSLLSKAIVAQALFDSKFLVAAAPEAPAFYLVPGDNEVTVVWEPSVTETVGDPFFGVASNPASAAYDPNFVSLDVEGYRIYRGRTPAQLELIAQFDYDGSSFTDRTGAFDYGGSCAPELSITAGCPVDFYNAAGTGAGETETHDIVDPFVQVVGGCTANGVANCFTGGRTELADGSVFILAADTVVFGGASGFPPLRNSGVPFAFIDRTVRNSFRYAYAVTAFDVNSLNSGPTSLESARITMSVVPRTTASNQVGPTGVTFALLDRDGDTLNVLAPQPKIDSLGRFSGPAPPTTAITGVGELFAGAMLDAPAQLTLTIDSINPQHYHDGTYYMTLVGPTDADVRQLSFGPDLPLSWGDDSVSSGPLEVALPPDPAVAESLGFEGIPIAGKLIAEVTVSPVTMQSAQADWHTGVDGAFWDDVEGHNLAGGSRWFDGDNEEMAHPTLGFLHGQLTGVNAIFSPAPRIGGAADDLFRRNFQTTYHVTRSADIKVYWGSTPGTVDSVIDVTHNMPLAFVGGADIGSGYGFRDDIAASSVVFAPADGLLDEFDLGHGPCFPNRPNWTSPGCETRPLLGAAVLEANVDVDFDGVSDGPGFAMYINGDFYVFQTDALPADVVWTYRCYNGLVEQTGTGYQYTPFASNAPIPGLRIQALLEEAQAYPDSAARDLSEVHTVPDPYYVTTALEPTANDKFLMFVNLPTRAIIRIYSLSGILVDIIEHNDEAGGGQAVWDLLNRNEMVVASGVYFAHIESATGQERIIRFTVVNFAM